MHRLSLGLLLAATLAAPAAPAAARAAEPVVPVQPGTQLTLTGHGYGHGRGLSQYGAQGAARQGRSATEILSFYYPGTSAGRAAGKISVRLEADTTVDTRVVARSGLVARVVGQADRLVLSTLRPAATQWRLKPAGAGTALAAKEPGKRWSRVRVLTGTVEFVAAGRPITLVLPTGTASYRGSLRNAAVDGGRDTVNVLGLEGYLRGVVAREMPASWSPAALQSQAVAARTYAAFERAHVPAGRAYQTCDSTSCQVYGGVAAETDSTDTAVSATAGQVLTYQGEPAFTQFSSSSGGWTVAGAVPYLVAQPDPYDDWAGNGVHDWTTKVAPSRLAAAWPSIGTPTGVQVLARDGHGEWGGRVERLRVTGSKGSVTVDGTAFRLALGLRSTWFTIG